VCPFIFGGRTAPTLADGAGVRHLAQAARWQLRSCRRVGAELFLVFAAAEVEKKEAAWEETSD
jgi:riboflavin biosynthesis pyrimidine reductase